MEDFVMYEGNFKEDLSKGQVMSPCVWDCFSVAAVQLTGYKSALISGAAVAANSLGLPDLGMMTIDELAWVSERICKYAKIPVLVDADEGYGDSPLNVYRNITKLVDAGVAGFTLDDGMGVRGFARLANANGKKPYDVEPMEKYLAKIKAALAAVEGTNCVLIARTECLPVLGFDEAIERCRRAVDLGAPMTLINRLKTYEDCKTVGERVEGWKMYPDIGNDKDGKAYLKVEDIYPFGFNYVTLHYLEKGAMWGMLDYGKHDFANKNTEYSANHDMGGLQGIDRYKALETTNEKDWLELEQKFYDSVKKN